MGGGAGTKGPPTPGFLGAAIPAAAFFAPYRFTLDYVAGRRGLKFIPLSLLTPEFFPAGLITPWLLTPGFISPGFVAA